jgi:hypothetical protein
MARKKLYGAAAAAHAKKMGRSGGGKRRKSTAMTHTTRTVHVHHKAKRKGGGKRKGSGGGGMKLTHLALATAGLAFVTKAGATTGFQKSINDAMDKVPGTKTFGATAMLGVAALAVDRFVKPNKWLKLLGTAGIVLAAAQIGSKGTDFKFLGDDSETGDYELEGDEDIEDVDDIEDDDDIGDDDDE